MKKILLLIIGIILIFPVYAAENRLYFTNEGRDLYYDGRLLNEDYFMKHLEMVPGYTASDELVIENGTDTTCKLYFKVVPSNQNAYAENLLDNILMKVYLDGSLMYDGKAKGLDYNSSGVNLQNLIEIGTFTPGSQSLMSAEIKLDTSYENPTDDDTATINWHFYGQCDGNDPIPDPEPQPEPDPKPEPQPEPEEPIEILPKPQTGIATNVLIYMITVFAAAITLTLVFILDKKKKNK